MDHSGRKEKIPPDWRWGDDHLTDDGEEILPFVWSLKPQLCISEFDPHGFDFFLETESDVMAGKSRDSISCLISRLRPATFLQATSN